MVAGVGADERARGDLLRVAELVVELDARRLAGLVERSSGGGAWGNMQRQLSGDFLQQKSMDDVLQQSMDDDGLQQSMDDILQQSADDQIIDQY